MARNEAKRGATGPDEASGHSDADVDAVRDEIGRAGEDASEGLDAFESRGGSDSEGGTFEDGPIGVMKAPGAPVDVAIPYPKVPDGAVEDAEQATDDAVGAAEATPDPVEVLSDASEDAADLADDAYGTGSRAAENGLDAFESRGGSDSEGGTFEDGPIGVMKSPGAPVDVAIPYPKVPDGAVEDAEEAAADLADDAYGTGSDAENGFDDDSLDETDLGEGVDAGFKDNTEAMEQARTHLAGNAWSRHYGEMDDSSGTDSSDSSDGSSDTDDSDNGDDGTLEVHEIDIDL